jgi:hypothetical protein
VTFLPAFHPLGVLFGSASAMMPFGCIRQRTSAYVSICSASAMMPFGCIRQRTSAYVSICSASAMMPFGCTSSSSLLAQFTCFNSTKVRILMAPYSAALAE